MRLPVIASLLCLCLTLPVAGQSDRAARVSPRLAAFDYGIYCAQEPERRDPAPATASGEINIVPAIPNFAFNQRIVPAEIGIGFGVLVSAPLGALYEPVTVTVTHPPYSRENITVEQWVTDVDDGRNLMGFSFDHEFELVLGEWTFSATTLDGEELYHIAFEVVAPEAMPQVVSACFGAFMS
ncbi:DUF3859 domain-containing protein [Gymnodinialimonas ceratoperidinii]|uniref:DUF3859 domain-containing protein n=1 Tax=Gymnodinialimonas ceratoperidinii TaxID=2856823 RepID=A0A8F6TVG4_9RHOB|nr:DUF3859 domain-containing protein [Gymnodinialimonas ceratoperidinii]QXT39701.1 DUF3859 domain-containing protein [Gymnodinialimonas ceratoperidinii]